MKVNKYVWFMFPTLLTAVLIVLTPKISFGGLAEIAKAKAAEALIGTVMKEIDKKIADAVGKKSISEADKADITKKLSGIAKPIVKKLIDEAVSGQLPSPADLVSAVIKDILPQVDELADAIIEAERSKNAADEPSPQAQPLAESHDHPAPSVESHHDQPAPVVESHHDQPAPLVESHDQSLPQIESQEFESIILDQPIFQTQAESLFESESQVHQPIIESAPTVHQPIIESPPPAHHQPVLHPPPPVPVKPSAPRAGKHNIVAVYVTGGNDVSVEIKESVGAGILSAIVKNKKHAAIENGEAFLAEVDALRSTQTDNTVYDSQISEIGVKFGVSVVCAAEITTTSEAYHVLARMIDAQTGEAVSVGNAFSPLKSEDDIAVVSGELVKKMMVELAEPQPQPSLPPEPMPMSTQPSPSSQSYLPHLPSPLSLPLENEDKHTSMTGFSFGYGLSQDAKSNSGFLQLGFVHSRQIFKEFVSVNVEGNFWLSIIGEYKYKYYDGAGYDYASNSFDFFGANVPVTILFQLSVFSFEAGLFGDALFVDSETFYNAGFVAGAGVAFDKKRARRYFYKYNSGYNYVTHVVGMRWLF